MIKFITVILALLLLQGCNNIPYQRILPLVKSSIIGPEDILVDQNIIDQKKFSFIKVRFGRKSIALMTLVNVNNDVYKWISSDDVKIYTYNGKVIKIENFDNLNFEITNYRNLDIARGTNELIFHNPLTFFSQDYELHKSPENNNKFEVLEHVNTNEFRWSHTNRYYYSFGKPISTTQYIVPRMPSLKIDFYYK